MSSTSMMYGDATIFDLLGCCCVVCSCSLLEPLLVFRIFPVVEGGKTTQKPGCCNERAIAQKAFMVLQLQRRSSSVRSMTRST